MDSLDFHYFSYNLVFSRIFQMDKLQELRFYCHVKTCLRKKPNQNKPTNTPNAQVKAYSACLIRQMCQLVSVESYHQRSLNIVIF